MKTIIIDADKLQIIIEAMEQKRDEHFKSSAEYIEKDEIINVLMKTISKCEVKQE